MASRGGADDIALASDLRFAPPRFPLGQDTWVEERKLSGNRKDGLNNKDPLPFYLVLAFQALLIMLVVILVVIIKLA
jgi:hypothetical protein